MRAQPPIGPSEQSNGAPEPDRAIPAGVGLARAGNLTIARLGVLSAEAAQVVSVMSDHTSLLALNATIPARAR